MAKDRALIKKLLSLSAYMAMAAVMAYVLLEQERITLAVGDRAPIEERFEEIAGQARPSFKSMLARPLLVNFWAIWCQPCLAELPVINEMAKKYQGKINFLGLAIASTKDELRAFKYRFSLSYPLGIADKALADKWHAHALPTTYLIDSSGIILWAKAGKASRGELTDVIDRILSKKSQQFFTDAIKGHR